MSVSPVRRLLLCTAGHVGHGKTSLVRALTGVDIDQSAVEKATGHSNDVGRARLDLGDVQVDIIDPTQHERWIECMLAYAKDIDVAMLVVAADDAILPQTREHVSVLQLLGIEQGLIVMTSTDRVERDWCDIVEDDIVTLVKGTFLQGAPIVRMAVAPTGSSTDREALKSAMRHVCADIQPRTATGARRLPEVCMADGLKPSRLLVAELRCAAGDNPRAIKHCERYRLHLGMREVVARVLLLEGTTVPAGGTALAVLICAEPVAVTCGQPLLLRLESPPVTVGGGQVLQPAPRRPVRRRQWSAARKEMLLALRSLESRQRAQAAIYFFGAQEWSVPELCRDANLQPEQATAIAQDLQSDGTLLHVQAAAARTNPVHRVVLEEIENQVIAALRSLHAGHPGEPAFSRAAVIAAVPRSGSAAMLDSVLDRLIRHGRIGGDEQRVMLTADAPKLSPRQIAARQRLLSAYAEAGLAPPMPSDLAEELGVSAADVRQLLSLCVAQKLLVHLGTGWYLTTAAEAQMRRQAAAALHANPAGVTLGQLRDALGTTRKYALPFAEYLDRVGVTKRIGDVRVSASR